MTTAKIQPSKRKDIPDSKNPVLFPPQYTSQECSLCHRIVKKSLSQRTHACECGCILDRDENASRNLLAKGLEFLSRGRHSRIKDTALGGFPDLKQVSGTPKDIQTSVK